MLKISLRATSFLILKLAKLRRKTSQSSLQVRLKQFQQFFRHAALRATKGGEALYEFRRSEMRRKVEAHKQVLCASLDRMSFDRDAVVTTNVAVQCLHEWRARTQRVTGGKGEFAVKFARRGELVL